MHIRFLPCHLPFDGQIDGRIRLLRREPEQPDEVFAPRRQLQALLFAEGF